MKYDHSHTQNKRSRILVLQLIMTYNQHLSFLRSKNKTFLFDVHYRRWEGGEGHQESEFLCLGKRLPAGLLHGGTCHWKSSER